MSESLSSNSLTTGRPTLPSHQPKMKKMSWQLKALGIIFCLSQHTVIAIGIVCGIHYGVYYFWHKMILSANTASILPYFIPGIQAFTACAVFAYGLRMNTEKKQKLAQFAQEKLPENTWTVCKLAPGSTQCTLAINKGGVFSFFYDLGLDEMVRRVREIPAGVKPKFTEKSDPKGYFRAAMYSQDVNNKTFTIIQEKGKYYCYACEPEKVSSTVTKRKFIDLNLEEEVVDDFTKVMQQNGYRLIETNT